MPWSSRIKFSRRGFVCGYCGKKRVGAYRWVDDHRSCEKCNRLYDYNPPAPKKVKCPICHGTGVIE